MSYHKVLEKVEQIPFEPGCYLYKNDSGEIIYVGKAKSLRKRVRQYFDKDNFEDPKIEVLRSQIADVEWITVETETEAFILESNLIKKYHPKFNKLQKDDKRYAWLKITNEDYPKVLRIREKKRDKAEYFGPYPNGSAARTTLNFLRKIYPYRVCTKKMHSFKKDPAEYDNPKNIIDYRNGNGTFRHTKSSRLCLDYHLRLCSGVCDNLISPEDYAKSIEKIREFLKGNQLDVIKDLNSKMHKHASSMEFEAAAIIRDQISELSYITQKIGIQAGQDENLVQARKQHNSEDIAKKLFEKLSLEDNSGRFRMECYDVSNIQGTNPVTSMVVFEKGAKKSSDYRFFRIRLKETPDDFHMMEEALERRLKYLTNLNPSKFRILATSDSSFTVSPDLIIVDGGKGQLSMALGVIEKYGLDIPAIGIAKQEEEIIQRIDGVYKPYRLRKDSKILHLVQNIRDEAHRFAITRHRNLRGKKALQSILTEIPGIGLKSIEKLLKHFGTVDNIKQSNFDELSTVLENKAKAADVIKFFK